MFMRVTAEIRDGKCNARNRICVRFAFSRELLGQIKKIPGSSYVKKPPKHWHVPQDMETCRLLRAEFGDELEFGPNLKAWGESQIRTERKMGSIAKKDTATLTRLPFVLPQLYEAVHLGPLGKHMTEQEKQDALLAPGSYQCADTEFLAQGDGTINGNEQGTGKTIEWIASVWEAGLEEGDHLIICPKAAADATWEPELEKWQAEVLDQVGIFMCVQDEKEERQQVIDQWLSSDKPVRWVIVNPHMLMMRKDPYERKRKKYVKEAKDEYELRNGERAPRELLDDLYEEALEIWPRPRMTMAVKGARKEETACRCRAKKGPHEHYEDPFPELYATTWRTVCIDEAHKGVVRNHKGITFKSLTRLDVSDKKCCMSGTPMKKLGGVDLWGMLHYLHPEQFSSYWQFADSFFEVTDNGFGKKVGLLRPERQEAMFRQLSPYLLRRTKKECAPWLPEKLYVDVPVHMTARQKQQYERMERDAFLNVGTHELSASATLDKLVRLKQFANAHCRIDEDGKVQPIDSPKVDAMMAKMEECGLFEPGEQSPHLVFSQSRRMCKLIYDRLAAEGLRVGAIAGGTKNRRQLREDFQSGKYDALVIVTTAGGVSLTLDRADYVHLIDEMWSPDEDEQAEDRAHRVSRIHQVTVFIYRSVGTIDEDIAVSKADKKESHEIILDVRRRVMNRVRT